MNRSNPRDLAAIGTTLVVVEELTNALLGNIQEIHQSKSDNEDESESEDSPPSTFNSHSESHGIESFGVELSQCFSALLLSKELKVDCDYFVIYSFINTLSSF